VNGMVLSEEDIDIVENMNFFKTQGTQKRPSNFRFSNSCEFWIHQSATFKWAQEFQNNETRNSEMNVSTGFSTLSQCIVIHVASDKKGLSSCNLPQLQGNLSIVYGYPGLTKSMHSIRITSNAAECLQMYHTVPSSSKTWLADLPPSMER
jgi:hypothetical protein